MKNSVAIHADFPTALDALTTELRGREFDPTKHYVVLTPDRYTLQVESALFKNTGALDCEALTLSRLSRRVLGDRKTLSREGCVMLVAQAIADVSGELEYYKQAVKYYDFARQVYETLVQISASFASDDDRLAALKERASGITRLKLADLEKIEQRYKRYKADRLDASDRLTELLKAIPTSDFVRRTRFYLVGYSDPTKLNRRVFAALEKYGAAYKYFDAAPPEERRHPNIAVYRTPDAVTGYKAVAMRIVNAVKSGKYSFGDISVVCPDVRIASRIFREYGIDFYADETVALDRTQPTMLLSLCYKLLNGGSSDDVIALCKNPFSGCDADDAEKLQNYIAEHGIDYGALSLKLDGGAAKAIERANAVVGAFASKPVFNDACEAVMEFCGFEDVAATDAYKDATDMLRPLYSAIGEIKACGTGKFDIDARSFFSMAKEIKVRSRPRYADQVTVCLPPTLRMTRSKLLFVTDFNEGVLPTVTQDSGLLSDAELGAMGGAIEPTARERNRRDRAELTAVMNNAEKVFCTYSSSGNDCRAVFLSVFADETKDIKYADDIGAVASGDFDKTLEFCCTVSSAREIAARRMTPYADVIGAAVGSGEHAAAPFAPEIGNVERPVLSVTELSHWFDCPYKRFLTDSIGIGERKRGYDAADFGTYMHDFMRRFVECGTYDTSPSEIDRLMRETLDAAELTDDEKRELLTDKRFMSDAAAFAEVNRTIIQAGSYAPARSEDEFGGGMTLGSHAVPFKGKIDRIDFCGDRARVIDYKTGDKKFDEKKCLDGRDMQLPLYAAVVEEKYGKTVTGMFFSTLGAPYDGGDRRLRGCVVKDASVISEYDRDLECGASSRILSAGLTKDGKVSERNRKGLYEPESFRALIDTCVKNANVAADEITSGYIERTPADGACDYCPYVGLCTVKNYRFDDEGDGEDE